VAYVSCQTVVQPRPVGLVLGRFLRRRGVWPSVSIISMNIPDVGHTGTRRSHPRLRKSSPACCPLLAPGRGISTRLVTARRDGRKSCQISGEGIVRKRSNFGRIRCHVGVGRCGGRSKRLDREGNEKRSSHLQIRTGLALWFELQDER
jgi:hypothetical protein